MVKARTARSRWRAVSVVFMVLTACGTTSSLNRHRTEGAALWNLEAGRLKAGQSKAEVEATMEKEPFSRHRVEYLTIAFPKGDPLEGTMVSQLWWEDEGGHLLRWPFWDVWDCFVRALDADTSVVPPEDREALKSYRPASHYGKGMGFDRTFIFITRHAQRVRIGERSEMREVDVTALVYNYGGAHLRVALLFVNDQLLSNACPHWVQERDPEIVTPTAQTVIGQ